MGALCRLCAAPLEHAFADLGMTPLANSDLGHAQANAMEPFYPLRAYGCQLVQLEEFETPEVIFPTTRTSRRTPRAGSNTRSVTSP